MAWLKAVGKDWITWGALYLTEELANGRAELLSSWLTNPHPWYNQLSLERPGLKVACLGPGSERKEMSPLGITQTKPSWIHIQSSGASAALNSPKDISGDVLRDWPLSRTPPVGVSPSEHRAEDTKALCSQQRRRTLGPHVILHVWLYVSCLPVGRLHIGT